MFSYINFDVNYLAGCSMDTGHDVQRHETGFFLMKSNMLQRNAVVQKPTN